MDLAKTQMYDTDGNHGGTKLQNLMLTRGGPLTLYIKSYRICFALSIWIMRSSSAGLGLLRAPDGDWRTRPSGQGEWLLDAADDDGFSMEGGELLGPHSVSPVWSLFDLVLPLR